MGGSGTAGIRLRAAALALAAAALACGPAPPLRFDRIVLVSVDTLRADHLGLYGYPRETSPFLDGLAEEGVVFERAYTPMPITGPAHASLFTALHPIQHRMRTNGARLSPAASTLAEVLGAAGFTTAGFTGTHAHWQPTGLARGFAHFDPRPKQSPEVYRRADETVDAALAWLAGCPCERLFLFVHLFDPHQPLQPPEAQLAAFQAQPPQARERHVEFLARENGLPLAFYRGDPGAMLFIVDRYDAEIRFADRELRRLYEGMRARGLDDGTLWVVTADHGEGLGSHAFMGHGKVYEEGVRVPLLFHAMDGRLDARRVAGIVEHVDLRPTLVELAGLPAAPGGAGRSLVPALRGEAAPVERHAFSQRGQIVVGPGIRRLPQEDVGDLSADQYAWIGPRWKYLHHRSGHDELYDLEADPHETRNLLAGGAGDVPPAAERLREALVARIAELEQGALAAGPAHEPDEATKAELRALGYVP